jgi:hypothetical protein
MANIFVAATATFNGKALARGKKEVSAFDKQVKKLGRTFAGVFGASALLNYSKNAIKAFAADEAAAKSLELQLKNTGFAFASPAVEAYINNLQRVTGVLDDQLRPAFQQLLTVTGSITKSQEALNTALDISAATGKSLTEVSAALTRGFSGNTAGLSRLGAGISKATLKTGDMDKILGELNQKFSGQAAARLDTYAGKMDLLKVASADASEIIGKSLLEALTKLGKNESIEDLADDMATFATGIANVITGIGELAGALSTLRNTAGFKQLIDLLTFGNIFDLVGRLGTMSTPKATSNFTYELGASATKDIERANAIIKGNKARATELKLLKEKNALEALKMKYDTERIGLMKALNEATDEETRTRLAEKLAILDGNAAKAQQYLADTELTFQTNQLAKSMNNAALSADVFSNFAMGAVQRGEYADAYKNLSNVPSSGGGYVPAPSMTMAADYQAYRAGERGDVVVNVAGSVLTEQSLTDTITDTILRINKMGRGTTPAGGLSGGT